MRNDDPIAFVLYFGVDDVRRFAPHATDEQCLEILDLFKQRGASDERIRHRLNHILAGCVGEVINK